LTEPATILPKTDMVVVTCRASIARPAAVAWARVGAFADAGRFLDIPCKLVAGGGGLGSLRQVGEVILEAKVGEGLHSYSYVQVVGPMAAFGYHGNVAVVPDEAAASHLIYALIFDAATMDPARRQHEIERLTSRFQGAADAMKRAAET